MLLSIPMIHIGYVGIGHHCNRNKVTKNVPRKP